MLGRVIRTANKVRMAPTSAFFSTAVKDNRAAPDTSDPDAYRIPVFSQMNTIPNYNDPTNPFIDIVQPPVRKFDITESHGETPLGLKIEPVYIYKPTKNAMMNEKNDTWGWTIKNPTTNGFTNPLHGQDHVNPNSKAYPIFKSADEAIIYCKRNALPYVVLNDPVRTFKKKAYADCFKWKGLPKKEEF